MKNITPSIPSLSSNLYTSYGMVGWTPTIVIEGEMEETTSSPDIFIQRKVLGGENEEGYACQTCHDFYPYAELNLPREGLKTHFRCYSCRKGLRGLFR